jgi:hypothetical protein
MNANEYEKAKKAGITLYHDPGADWEDCTNVPDKWGNVQCDEPDHFSARPFRWVRAFGWVNS